MYISLWHGRNNPDEAMEDWGYEGPSIEGVEQLWFTYMGTIRVSFFSVADCAKAKALTGWDSWDHETLEIRVEGDCVRLDRPDGKAELYGDWSLVDDRGALMPVDGEG